jgi:hypothetical protein
MYVGNTKRPPDATSPTDTLRVTRTGLLTPTPPACSHTV